MWGGRAGGQGLIRIMRGRKVGNCLSFVLTPGEQFEKGDQVE